MYTVQLTEHELMTIAQALQDSAREDWIVVGRLDPCDPAVVPTIQNIGNFAAEKEALARKLEGMEAGTQRCDGAVYGYGNALVACRLPVEHKGDCKP